MFVSSKVEDQLLLSPVSPPPSLPLYLPIPLFPPLLYSFLYECPSIFPFPSSASGNTFSWYNGNSIEL